MIVVNFMFQSSKRKTFSQLFLLQHDDHFFMMRDPIYTQQLASPEQFFVRKFDKGTNITSKQLRMEEAELESNLLSLQEPEMQFRTRNFTRIRDYLTLCRGGTLVNRMIFCFLILFHAKCFLSILVSF